MAVPKFEFTPIIAPGGKIVHATSFRDPTRTVCRRKFSGWHVGCRRIVNCKQCKLAIVWNCQKRKPDAGDK